MLAEATTNVPAECLTTGEIVLIAATICTAIGTLALAAFAGWQIFLSRRMIKHAAESTDAARNAAEAARDSAASTRQMAEATQDLTQISRVDLIRKLLEELDRQIEATEVFLRDYQIVDLTSGKITIPLGLSDGNLREYLAKLETLPRAFGCTAGRNLHRSVKGVVEAGFATNPNGKALLTVYHGKSLPEALRAAKAERARLQEVVNKAFSWA